MWPMLLDMTKEESVQNLRNLELEAYSHLVSALRAQGPLNADRRKILKETGVILNISEDRHKAEVRRAVSDEKLNTIAYHISGQVECLEDWVQEGRRAVPLLTRTAPQTAYSAIADEAADSTHQNNKELPSPSATERKRQSTQALQNVAPEGIKPTSFRIPEPPKPEESKKRKLPSTTENSSLAQHLLGPSKMSKIQQIYRQRTKAKAKEHLHLKYKQEEKDNIQHIVPNQLAPAKVQQVSAKTILPTQVISSSPKILQNITIQPPTSTDEIIEQMQPDNSMSSSNLQKQNDQNHPPSPSETPSKPRLPPNIKPNTNFTIKHASASPVCSADVQKTLKMSLCPRKAIPKSVVPGQKLIVVTSSQTIPSTSILQRTLTIPHFMKNISVKNLEKFKIVTSNPTVTSSGNIQVPTVPSTNNINSVKHKVVTVRTNTGSSTKKVIPLSQLQMLNTKCGIKVLPIGGKIVAKTSTSTTSSSVYIMNTINNIQTLAKTTPSLSVVSASKISEQADSSCGHVSEVPDKAVNSGHDSSESGQENGKSSVLEDILKASGVITSEENTDNSDTRSENMNLKEDFQNDYYSIESISNAKKKDYAPHIADVDMEVTVAEEFPLEVKNDDNNVPGLCIGMDTGENSKDCYDSEVPITAAEDFSTAELQSVHDNEPMEVVLEYMDTLDKKDN